MQEIYVPAKNTCSKYDLNLILFSENDTHLYVFLIFFSVNGNFVMSVLPILSAAKVVKVLDSSEC